MVPKRKITFSNYVRCHDEAFVDIELHFTARLLHFQREENPPNNISDQQHTFVIKVHEDLLVLLKNDLFPDHLTTPTIIKDYNKFK